MPWHHSRFESRQSSKIEMSDIIKDWQTLCNLPKNMTENRCTIFSGTQIRCYSFVPYSVPTKFSFEPRPPFIGAPSVFNSLWTTGGERNHPFNSPVPVGKFGWWGRGAGLSLNGDSPVLDIQPVPAHHSTCFRSATHRIDSLRVYFIRLNMRYCLSK
jgi:hypothetical protein